MEPEQHTIAVAIVTNDKQEILLAKRYEPESAHTHGKWEFVGGGIEFGEKPEQAVIREAMEEAGIEVKVVRLLPKIISNIWEFFDGSKQQILIISYECKIISGIPTPKPEHNTGDIKFFAIEEIKSLDTLPKVYEMSQMALT
ncbi:MAG: NUDIX hydrolase [Candidatus Doudnabacteria bacterium]|nr:NUDIX hydrolase [Candidatus Doudnabacteria bacterium]